METCQAIGIAILIFEVLPQLDVIRGAMLTNGVCFIPAVLRKLPRFLIFLIQIVLFQDYYPGILGNLAVWLTCVLTAPLSCYNFQR